jgi:hypothetical protein
MHYSADSVIIALKASNLLFSKDYDNVKCPSPCPFSVVHEKDCPGDNFNCMDCNSQICEQNLAVYKDPERKQLLRILVFRFMVSTRNNNGYIHKTDSALMQLIKHKYIDPSKLRFIDIKMDISQSA